MRSFYDFLFYTPNELDLSWHNKTFIIGICIMTVFFALYSTDEVSTLIRRHRIANEVDTLTLECRQRKFEPEWVLEKE